MVLQGVCAWRRNDRACIQQAVRTKLTIALLAGAIAALPAIAPTPAGAAGPASPAVAVPAAITAGPEALQRLADRLRRLEEDGLDPAWYGIPAAAQAQADPAGFRDGVMRAAAAALTDLLHGRVQGIAGRADLRRDTASVPLAPWIAELSLIAEPATVIDRAALLPPEAAVLKRSLAEARARVAAGGWPTIPGDINRTLEPGSIDPRVAPLRARLVVTDRILAANPGAGDLYDTPLQEAVKRFQAAEGLEADARVGRISWAALNRPAEAVVRQLRVALDMRRAQGAAPAERHIEVNVPHQRLQVVDHGRTLLDMAVIVGRPGRATPMLRARLVSVMFNPPWGVPERNAREDLLPRYRRDPRAMMEKGFRLFTRVDGQMVEVDPTTVDWSTINQTRFPYYVRQDAGDANALGRIKFVMPNGDDIYMHDTPDRHLFRRPDRAFSSGCIRLENPQALLDLTMEGVAGWDRDRVSRVLASRATTSMTVARSMPVRLHYTTVITEGNDVRIRGDIYGLDAAYARAMEAPRGRVVAAATR